MVNLVIHGGIWLIYFGLEIIRLQLKPIALLLQCLQIDPDWQGLLTQRLEPPWIIHIPEQEQTDKYRAS